MMHVISESYLETNSKGRSDGMLVVLLRKYHQGIF